MVRQIWASRAVIFAGLLVQAMLGSMLGTRVQAGFHDGGVAVCGACHTMHNSQDGIHGDLGQQGGNSLLKINPPSDLCLSCHADHFGSVMSSNSLNPLPERGPGDFVFLLESNINDEPMGGGGPISGDHAGHNIKAPGHGLSSDGTYQTSPGGNYPAMNLKCTSCHDPHGNENYRMLRGVGQNGPGRFFNPAPIAEGIPLGLSEFETDFFHNAYTSGMSQWCANCHQDYLTNDHQIAGVGFKHPIDTTMDPSIISWYGYYNGSADPTGGDLSASYLAEVPFEDPANTLYSTGGPGAASRIMCLTCHRAHASSGPYSGRWDFNVATLGQDGVVSGSFPIPNPYPDPDQQPLCYKCHETGGN